MKTLKTIILLFPLLFVSCVQETRIVSVHFQVDMTQLEEGTEASLIGGYFPLRWNKKTPMHDRDSNGVFDTIITFDMPYKFLEFKFVKDGNTIELDGQDNRRVYFDERDTAIVKATFDQL